MEITELKGWQLAYAIRRAVQGRGKAALEAVLRDTTYTLSTSDRNLLADYIAGHLNRPANRPRSSDHPHALALRNPLLWLAVDYVERYKYAQKHDLRRTKGVEPEAIDHAMRFIAQKYGGATQNADERAITKAIEVIALKCGYRLTPNKIADQIGRGGTRPRKRRV